MWERTRAHEHTQVHTLTNMCTHNHAYTQTCITESSSTNAYSHVHTHILHTHTQTHKHAYICISAHTLTHGPRAYTQAGTRESTRARTHSHTHIQDGAQDLLCCLWELHGVPVSSSFLSGKPLSHPCDFPFYHPSLALIHLGQQNVSFANSAGILHFLLGVTAGSQVIHTQTSVLFSCDWSPFLSPNVLSLL